MLDITSFTDAFDAATDSALSWVSDNGESFFDFFRWLLEGLYDAILWALQYPPAFVITGLVALVAWRTVNIWFACLSGVAMFLCSAMGLWEQTMSTLALVLTATCFALALGIPIGIAAGFSNPLEKFLRPCLDLVQTLPPYIYLLPAIALLGYGPATALVATVIVAMPPVVRLTSLGIRMTPKEFIELGEASGITPAKMFVKIRLPFAVPSIMAGINQSLMMAFGMVVIAGIVGSEGLGETIYGAIRTLDIASSINGAIAIVVLTIILDRITQSAGVFRKTRRT